MLDIQVEKAVLEALVKQYTRWPRMSAEIKSWIEKCESCRSYEKSHPNEILMSLEFLEKPCQNEGVDSMTCK